METGPAVREDMKLKKKVKGNRRRKEPFLVRARRVVVRTVKIAAVAVLVPTIVYASVLGYGWLKTTDMLSVEVIDVSGSKRVSAEDVVALAGITRGRNMLSFSSGAVEDNILRNAWISSAVVKRRPPHTIEIDVREREPLALVKMDGLFVMDVSGVIFKKYLSEDSLDLPVVTGLNMEGLNVEVEEAAVELEHELFTLMSVLKGRQGFNLGSVSEIHVDQVYGLTVYTLEGGVRLEVGTERFPEKIAAFEKILEARKGSLHGIEAMDLSNEHKVIVRFTSNVVKEGGVI